LNTAKKVDHIKSRLEESCQVHMMMRVDDHLIEKILSVSGLLIDAFNDGKKVLVFGNGGSASDAQHFVAELVGQFRLLRRPLPAIALTTNSSIITSISNDRCFEDVFSRQVEALTNWGDIVIGISTSGTSKNVLSAMKMAQNKNAKTVGLTGLHSGDLGSVVDLLISIPSNVTPRIQEGHILVLHLIADLVERDLFE
jgi:D-sedoheptulose 7-phosphate isomerase